jgi:hypothetical protein
MALKRAVAESISPIDRRDGRARVGLRIVVGIAVAIVTTARARTSSQ